VTQPDATALTLFDDGGSPLPVDATGLSVPVDAATALAALPRVRRLGAAVRWVQGDLVLALIDGDTSRLWEARQIIDGLDLDDQPSLQKSIAVAMLVPRERRRAALSWSHHAAVAGLEPEQQVRWLGEAEERGLTVRQLEEAIAAELFGDPEPEPLPLPKPWTETHAAVLADLDRAFGADAAVVVVHRDGRVLTPSGDIAAALEGLG